MKGRLKVNIINDSTLKEDMEFISNSMNFKQLEDKTILLTGSTGLVGSQLLRALHYCCLLYTSPRPRDRSVYRIPSCA